MGIRLSDGTGTKFYFGVDGGHMLRFGSAADASFRRSTGRDWAIKADDRYAFTAPESRFQPNRFGLFDMHGSVWQWCADRQVVSSHRRAPIPAAAIWPPFRTRAMPPCRGFSVRCAVKLLNLNGLVSRGQRANSKRRLSG
jgi:formylglycine-generating enzyme required for sulfatase activity